jgi:hypothetical protein
MPARPLPAEAGVPESPMTSVWSVVAFVLCLTCSSAMAGPASGSVRSKTGAILPKRAVAYVVRDARNARESRVEVLLTDATIDTARLRGELDPHLVAINLEALRDHDYLLLWVAPDGTVTMNATYSKTMTQYLNDTDGGLMATFTANTASKVEGRVHSPVPLKSLDGASYTIDVKFSADVIAPLAGAPLPPGGGEAGAALTAFLGAVRAKDWTAIRTGLGPAALPLLERSYNSPAENAASAADLFAAWLPMDALTVGEGQLVTPTTAVLEVVGQRFGSPWLSLVRMVRTGDAWQFDQAAPAGAVR